MRLSSWLRPARSRVTPSGTGPGRPARPTKRAPSTRLSVENLEDRTVPSTFTVSNLADSGPGSLRAAITAANATPGADVIAFTPGLRGTVGLTSGELGITGDLRIDGPGAARLAVSGNDASRVFTIGSGTEVSIDGLTVTRGHALLQGGGILNAGTLTLSRAVVSDNVVVGLPGATPAVDAMGGGIRNTGALHVLYTTFVNNRSLGGNGNPGGTGSTGLGGAIMSAGAAAAPSSATVSHCTFLDNEAVGGAAGAGATFSRAGVGGAIVNANGTMAVSDSLFRDNQAVGGAGGAAPPGSAGVGGAIANAALLGDAILTVSHSALTNNRAVGGAAPAGASPQPGRGGAIANYVVAFSTLPVTATATVDQSLLLGNQAIGGAGPTGGDGLGGGIANENGAALIVTNSALLLNEAIGGAGATGNGGNGLGGGIFNGGLPTFNASSLTLDGSLVVRNRSAGGAAGDGGSAGLGVGGGLYLTPGGVACADVLTVIRRNHATTSDDDVFGDLGTC
jgi:hypothetical protein